MLSGNEATTVDGASTWTGTVIICAAGIPRANGATTVNKASTSSGTVAVAGVYTSVGIDAAITDAGVLSINGAATVDGASTMSSTVAIGGGQCPLLRAGKHLQAEASRL